MNLTLDLAVVETLMLASCRIAAFLFLAPPFAHRAIPGKVKAMLSVGLALAVAPRLPVRQADTTLYFLADVIMQVTIGAAMGFMVYLVFAAVQSAGTLIDLSGGFAMAAAFDPMSMTSSAQFGRLYQMLAVVLLFASDGYQIVIAGLARSFDGLPIGQGLDFAVTAEAMISGLTNMFVATLQIAGPLVVVLFLADVGLGLLTRVAPAMNAFALGFPLKILMTVSMAAFALLALPRIVAALTDQSFTTMLGIAR